MRIEINEEDYNLSAADSVRKISTSSSALGILRQQLVKNIGRARLKSFLFQFGWEMGSNDGKEALKTGKSKEDLIKHGPFMHIVNGHIRGIEKHRCVYELDESGKLTYYHGTGVWIGSFEAAEHLKHFGLSREPVCYMLTGYASGFMSTVFGETLIARELTCVGKGDDHCSWAVKPACVWEEEGSVAEHLNTTPIVQELELTFEQLLEERTFVTNLANFQKQLTEEIANGSTAEEIASFVSGMLDLPVFIEDIDHRLIAYAGLSHKQYAELSTDWETYVLNETDELFKRNEKKHLPFRPKWFSTPLQKRLVSPLVVEREVVGYCSFLYMQKEGASSPDEPSERDELFLDRVAGAVSLVLLNEKTKFESFERMKGNFFEQILDGNISEDDVLKRGKYTGLDLNEPYYIAVIDTKDNMMEAKQHFLWQEQLLDTTYTWFYQKKLSVMAGLKNGKLILFLPKSAFSDQPPEKPLRTFCHYLEKTFPNRMFRCGLSTEGCGIMKAFKYYEEALLTTKLSNRAGVSTFQSLGIVGVLVSSKNKNGIERIAEHELAPLWPPKGDPKQMEMLKTLYVFLQNGGKLESTMSELSLSLSGLRHRIRRLEELLGKNLREPAIMHELLLIMKALIAIDRLNTDN